MQEITLEKLEKPSFFTNEAYKLLRTNIQLCGNNIKVICITSCLPNEGKSYVSFHLAESFAEAGKMVLYIDTDLRRSVTVGRLMPDKPVLGLTHYLSGQNDLSELLYETNIKNLDMIFTGPVPPNPAELLASDSFAELIKMLKGEYDYIIIDTPPLGSVVDSVIVAEQCDGVIMVIESCAISYKIAQRVKKQLEKSKCRLLGAVLNKVDLRSKKYKYYGRKYKKYKHYYTRNYYKRAYEKIIEDKDEVDQEEKII